MDNEVRVLLADTQRELSDARSEISHAVSQLETGGSANVEALLAEARSRLQIIEQRIARHLGES